MPHFLFPELRASKRIRNKENLVLSIVVTMERAQKIKLEIWSFEEHVARDFTQKDHLWNHSLGWSCSRSTRVKRTQSIRLTFH